MSARNWGLLLLLSLLWGSSFFFYKVLVAVLPPVTVVLGRVGIAAIALNLWLLAARTPMPLSPALWLRFLLLGLLNNVVPFILIAWGETRITSGMASILNATTPIFMVVVAHVLTRDEKLSVNKVAGIAFGFAGTVVLVGPDAFAGGSLVWGELAVIGASCVYAFAAVYSRRFTGLPPLQAATGQITGGAIILLPLSLLIDHPWTLPMPSLPMWASLLAIALMNTAAAYWVYYKMLATTGVTYISLVTFLIPPVALLLGVLFLNEVITAHALAGMAIIALGLAAIDGRIWTWLSRRPSTVD
jgi:drug/metabolite transporter (DMT)-like permease